MKRSIIAFAGAAVALGFLTASAVANYIFGESLGRTPHEAILYGIVGVLAVAMNALAPFYISWSLAAKRRITAAGVVVLWALCLAYSTTSALGFAAQNRESVAVSRQITQDAYEDIRRELFDLESRRKNASKKERPTWDSKVDYARARLAAAREQKPSPIDAQSQFLSVLTLGFLDAYHVRLGLVALFAVMVEVCATLGLFAALSHSSQKSNTPEQKPASPQVTQWKPKAAS
jgi:hypothetical protein